MLSNKNEILKEYISDAYDLLNKNCKIEFYQNKQNIKKVFELTRNIKNKENIRLTLIDALYSTNMKMAPRGLYDLSKHLKTITANDEKLSEIFLDYFNNLSNSKIEELFNNRYGIKEKERHAFSLISKYAYYLTEFKFPIYDRLGVNTIKKLSQIGFLEKKK